MPDETKVPVAPEATADESLIDNRRAEIEKLVIAENETIPDPETLETPEPLKAEEVKEVKAEESDPIKKIKDSVQKRIDKVWAQKKTAEERLAEAEAEVERLRAERLNPKPVETSQDNTLPTPEQVEAYIVKMQEEGNHKDAAAAIRYLIKLEKEEALKSVKEEQTRAQNEVKAKNDKQLEDWVSLQRDYQDINPELNLSNQKSLLYETALSLYQDKELHKDFYDNPDVMQGFRRAVSDAYREIHKQGLINTPKGEPVIPRTPRMSLADPSADSPEETVTQSNLNSLSDAEKVREEIKARNKNRFSRKVPQ